MIKEMGDKKERPMVGLVLSGGSARGLAHLGVISVLEEYNVPIDLIVATSYGAVIAGYHLSGYSLQDLIKMTKEFLLRKVLDLRRPFFKILSDEKVEYVFKKDINNVKIEDLRIPMYILVVDITNRKTFVFEKGPLSTALMASIAFPGLLSPYKYNDRLLIDGGILNKLLPLIAKQKGADMTIFSDVCMFSMLNKNKCARRIYELLLNHVSKKRQKLDQKLKRINLRYIIYRALCTVQDYHDQITDIKCKPDFLIEPVLREIKPLRFRKVDEAFELGKMAALRVIDDIIKEIYRGKM